MKEKHISVLLEEAIESLQIKEDGTYIDMTLGYAGHSKEILKRIKKGFLFAFDKDIDACNESKKRLEEIGSNFKIINTSFVNAYQYLEKENQNEFDGVLYDLGVSSVEIDEPSRGFSYINDARLDMRMDKTSSLSAYEVVNNYKEESLIKILREYGEEKHASKIARNIVKNREIKPIETTLELVDIIDEVIPFRDKRNTHPAKKTFQAIRIEVNNELEEFETSLRDSLKHLRVGGVISVITFHSLEDRICKKIFKEVTTIDPVIKGIPNIDKNLLPDYVLINNKPILPNKREIEYNSRSRSAKLRIIKRIK